MLNALVGADCSGVTTAILENVAMANGIVMVSPSATSPVLTFGYEAYGECSQTSEI